MTSGAIYPYLRKNKRPPEQFFGHVSTNHPGGRLISEVTYYRNSHLFSLDLLVIQRNVTYCVNQVFFHKVPGRLGIMSSERVEDQ